MLARGLVAGQPASPPDVALRGGGGPVGGRGSRCRRVGSTAEIASAGGVRSETSRQRDRIVGSTSSGCSDGTHSSTTVRGGGSSTIFNSAFAACSVSRSASSSRITCHLPSTGRRAERATTARISATEMDNPSGTTECTSGWLRVATV